MSSRKEEERNEKIIRGLMKLPPNRKCINCNSLGPQYVCTNFWTFVCITCSGIHREFTHRVKSVSMAKFTSQEVDALQKGGNQRAREIFLKDWDMQRQRLPAGSNLDKIREFIKHVYVDKKYAGGKSSDKPPRDTQTHKPHEEEHRRASSYHSFSQSPPYDYQYEDRKYGKQPGALNRKPGSERGLYEGKMPSFVYSPGRFGDRIYEDRFANEGSRTRVSDYSVSNTSDPFSYGSQSPNFQTSSGFSSPPSNDILVEDVQQQVNAKRDVGSFSHSQRTVSSGSFGSLDGNSISHASANSISLFDVEPEPSSVAEQATSNVPQSSGSPFTGAQDLFSQYVQLQETSSASTVDLFADMTHQKSTGCFVRETPTIPSVQNEGWATFDLPHQVASATQKNGETNPAMSPGNASSMGNLDTLSSANNRPQSTSVQSSTNLGPFSSAANEWHGMSNEANLSSDPFISERWNAFDDSNRKVAKVPLGSLLQKSESVIPGQKPIAASDHQHKVSLELWNAFGDSTGNLTQPSLENLLQNSETVVPALKPATSSDHQYKHTLEPWNAFGDSNGGLANDSFENLFQKSEMVIPAEKPTTSSDHHYKNSFEPWNAFGDSTENPAKAFEPFPQKNESLMSAQKHPLEVFGKDAIQGYPATTTFEAVISGASYPSFGGAFSHASEQKSINPFDIPFESDFEPSNTFMDMGSLKTALPNSSLPTAFLDGLADPWFAQSSVTPYMSSTSEGSLSYLAGQGQSSQLSKLGSQGPVASVGGNPFA